jgi:hypothetical protein
MDGNWTGGSFTCGIERPRRSMTLTLEERGGALSGALSAEIAPNSNERLTYRVSKTPKLPDIETIAAKWAGKI